MQRREVKLFTHLDVLKRVQVLCARLVQAFQRTSMRLAGASFLTSPLAILVAALIAGLRLIRRSMSRFVRDNVDLVAGMKVFRILNSTVFGQLADFIFYLLL